MANFISNTIIPIALGYPAGWLVCSTLTLLYYRHADLSKSRLVEDAEKKAEASGKSRIKAVSNTVVQNTTKLPLEHRMHVPVSEGLFSFPQNRTTFPPFLLDKTKVFSKIHL